MSKSGIKDEKEAKEALENQISGDANRQALSYTILSTNLLFLFFAIFGYTFINLDAYMNYPLSIGLSTAAVAFLSQSQK